MGSNLTTLVQCCAVNLYNKQIIKLYNWKISSTQKELRRRKKDFHWGVSPFSMENSCDNYKTLAAFDQIEKLYGICFVSKSIIMETILWSINTILIFPSICQIFTHRIIKGFKPYATCHHIYFINLHSPRNSSV